MRTTLDVDADILRSAKALADAEGKTLGQVLSELVRKGLAEAAEETPGLAGQAAPSLDMGEGGRPAAKAGRRGA
jgi:hypothetical protein